MKAVQDNAAKAFNPFRLNIDVESEQEAMFLLCALNVPRDTAGFETYPVFQAVVDEMVARGIDRKRNKFFAQNRDVFAEALRGNK